jgi:hypothetical protein
MNKKLSIQTLLILGTVLSIGMIGLPGFNIPLYAGDGYDGDNDDIDWKKFKNSETYEDADDDVQDCFKDAHDSGDNLVGYEVENCEDSDGDSYKNDDDDDGEDSDDGDDGDDGEDNKYSNSGDDDDGEDSDDGDRDDGDDGDDGEDSDDGDDGN